MKHLGVNFFAPIATIAKQLDDPILTRFRRRPGADEELMEFAKLAGRNSKERAATLSEQRRKWLSDVQADRDDAVDNQDWIVP